MIVPQVISSLTPGQILFGSPNGQFTTTSETDAQVPAPRAGTITGLSARLVSSLSGASSIIASFRVNGVDVVTLTFTAADAGGTIKSAVASAPVALGDLLSSRWENPAGMPTGTVIFSTTVDFA